MSSYCKAAMGLIISLFRRRKPTAQEQLDKIQDNLKNIEEYRRCTELKQKRLVRNILIYGSVLYILACVIVLFWYLPESWPVRVTLVIPFLLGPYIIYIIRKLISKYFNFKMSKAKKRYEELLKHKSDIINNIKETEAFNTATLILSKYAPEQLLKKEVSTTPNPELRKRIVPTTVLPPKPQTQVLQQVMHPVLDPLFLKTRNFLDKLMEYIVSDGPRYRYALICKHCYGHNGLSVREEFSYVAFNCCYCKKFNPAQSERPMFPVTAIEVNNLPAIESGEQSDSDGSNPAPTESETDEAGEQLDSASVSTDTDTGKSAESDGDNKGSPNLSDEAEEQPNAEEISDVTYTHPEPDEAEKQSNADENNYTACTHSKTEMCSSSQPRSEEKIL